MTSRRGTAWRDVVDLAREFPGVTIGTSYGTPALFVRRKLLVRLREDGESLAVRVDPYSRDLILREDPVMCFLTAHYRDHPWILVRLSRARRAALRERIEDAWRLVAGKRLIAGFDSGRTETASR